MTGFSLAVRMEGRAQAEGAFGYMGVARKGNENAVLSKPRRKPIDKLAETRFILLMLVEPRLALGDGCAAQRRQPDHVEAETGVEGRGQGVEPFACKAQENPVVAQGLAGFDMDMAHVAIDTEEGSLDQQRALALRFKLRKKRLRQFLQYVFDQLHPRDGFRQAAFGGAERQDAQGG